MKFEVAKYLPSRFWLQIALLMLSLFVFAGCSLIGGGGGGEEAPVENPEAAPPPPAKVTCSETCRNEGQCGNVANDQVVVLGRSDQPQTRDHDQLFPNDADVNIIDQQEKIVRRPTTGEEFNHLFVRVRMTVENGQEGWVADWCVARP